jgi:hypothetical protein
MGDVLLDFEGRNAVASSTGQRVALGAWEHSVVVVDLATGLSSKRLETTFDSGGDRLAISDELNSLIAAAYYKYGLASYCCATGRERWRRKDIQKVQQISLSRDGLSAYCGREGASLAVVDLRNGSTTRMVRGARAMRDSRFESVKFLDTRTPQLVDDDLRRRWSLRRTTFAFLDVCFAPGLVLLSEAGGPVRCIDIEGGEEQWRYTPKEGRHVLHLGYHEAARCLLGVEWPYVEGGAKRLIRWSPLDGTVLDSMILGQPADCCFALRGEVIVLSDGRVVSTTPYKKDRLE